MHEGTPFVEEVQAPEPVELGGCSFDERFGRPGVVHELRSLTATRRLGLPSPPTYRGTSTVNEKSCNVPLEL